MSNSAISLNKYAKGSVGTETRGKTATNRLRRVDHFVIAYCLNLLMETEHIFVDLGYGQTPITTLESAQRFRRYNKELRIVGVEIDKIRVREAQQFVDCQTHFRQGGFNIPLQMDVRTGKREKVNLIRAFNVLRQYEFESDCRKAHLLMGKYLETNGILIEGTSNPSGRIWVANIIRKQLDQSLMLEALVFSTNFRDEFDIASFQEVLPKNFIHRMTGNEEMIYNFFQDWKISYEQMGKSIQSTYRGGVRQQFIVTANYLADHYGYQILQQKKLLKRGYLIWLLKPGSKGVDMQQITYRILS